MTVAELRAKLADLPDDMLVVVHMDEGGGSAWRDVDIRVWSDGQTGSGDPPTPYVYIGGTE